MCATVDNTINTLQCLWSSTASKLQNSYGELQLCTNFSAYYFSAYYFLCKSSKGIIQ